jgi:hypothetical protein
MNILGSKYLDPDFSNLGICIMLGLWTLIGLKPGSLLMDTCWTHLCHTPPIDEDLPLSPSFLASILWMPNQLNPFFSSQNHHKMVFHNK